MSPLPLGIVAASGGVSNSYELIGSTYLSSTSSFILLDSIPQTYSSLQIRATLRDFRTTASSGNGDIILNGTVTASYAFHRLSTTGSSVVSAASSSAGSIQYEYLWGTAVSGNFTSLIMDIPDYASSSKNKTLKIRTGHTAGTLRNIRLISGLFNSTNPITSIRFNAGGDGFIGGSRISLYGIKGQ